MRTLDDVLCWVAEYLLLVLLCVLFGVHDSVCWTTRVSTAEKVCCVSRRPSNPPHPRPAMSCSAWVVRDPQSAQGHLRLRRALPQICISNSTAHGRAKV